MEINNDSEAGLYHRLHQIPLTDLSLGRDGNPWRVVRPTLMTLNTSNSTYSSVMPTMEADRQLSRISSVTYRGHSGVMWGDGYNLSVDLLQQTLCGVPSVHGLCV